VNKNNALGPLPDQMPAHEDRYAPLLLRPEYGYRLSAKKERGDLGLPFGILRCRIIDATRRFYSRVIPASGKRQSDISVCRAHVITAKLR